MDYLTLTVECDTIKVSIPSGTLSFSSNHHGADIYLIIGGISTHTQLQTPNTIDLYPGSYDYILRLAGFEDYTGIAVVYANETTFINVDLTPKVAMTTAPAPAPALVVIGSLSILGLLLAIAS